MKEEWLTKSEDISVLGYGKYPGARSIDELIKNGIIILDKWPGPTSHDAVSQIKKIFDIKKTGHAGTLDPMVTGVLPVTLDNACKIIPALQNSDKEYVGIMHLHKNISDENLIEGMQKVVGKISQMPPVRSAVARRERKRSVYSFEFLDRKNNDVAFRISCEAGTYVRVVCHQLGKDLGIGANMKELRRTKAGRFTENQSVKMQDIVDAYCFWKEDCDERIKELILPVEAAVEHLGKIIIKDSAVSSIVNGSPLYSNGICKVMKDLENDDLIALMTLKGELVALAKSNMSAGEMIRKKAMAAKTDRVILQKGLYPGK